MKGIRVNRARKSGAVPSLRPPTLMIDLLFGALMLFAFQMGDPTSKNVVPHDIELPTEDKNKSARKSKIFPLVPIKSKNKGWLYETTDGLKKTPQEIASLLQKEKRTPVLVLSKKVSVQDYLDAETPLRMLGLKVGLAVSSEEGRKK
jgi:biopolymer transport protein ExbD